MEIRKLSTFISACTCGTDINVLGFPMRTIALLFDYR